jgi:hypothetical protein
VSNRVDSLEGCRGKGTGIPFPLIVPSCGSGLLRSGLRLLSRKGSCVPELEYLREIGLIVSSPCNNVVILSELRLLTEDGIGVIRGGELETGTPLEVIPDGRPSPIDEGRVAGDSDRGDGETLRIRNGRRGEVLNMELPSLSLSCSMDPRGELLVGVEDLDVEPIKSDSGGGGRRGLSSLSRSLSNDARGGPKTSMKSSGQRPLPRSIRRGVDGCGVISLRGVEG